eukprot:9776807-Karenia_brevis.AAC.1
MSSTLAAAPWLDEVTPQVWQLLTSVTLLTRTDFGSSEHLPGPFRLRQDTPPDSGIPSFPGLRRTW